MQLRNRADYKYGAASVERNLKVGTDSWPAVEKEEGVFFEGTRKPWSIIAGRHGVQLVSRQSRERR